MDYDDGIQYNNSVMNFITTAEGRADNVDGISKYSYSYNLTDHLGNVRVTEQRNTANWELRKVAQEDEYYSFGLRKNLYSLSTFDNKYLYNGKEIQTQLTNQYDYGARFYDPVIARWTTMDPMAEDDDGMTPYNYGFNNPIVTIDPDGMFGDYYDADGTYIGNDGIDDEKVYSVNKEDYESIGDGKSNVYKATELKGINNNTLLAFAATIYNESGGSHDESYAIGNATMNFLKEGGSSSLHSLDDVTMYKNSFARGAKSNLYKKYMKSIPNGRNARYAVGAAINAIGYNQGSTGFSDYSNGANSWDGLDLVVTRAENSHRGYTWSSDSKDILTDYKNTVGGGVNVAGFTYKSSNAQISATKVAGKSLFTHLNTGRGERITDRKRFQKP